jgi:hypothetical protein
VWRALLVINTHTTPQRKNETHNASRTRLVYRGNPEKTGGEDEMSSHEEGIFGEQVGGGEGEDGSGGVDQRVMGGDTQTTTGKKELQAVEMEVEMGDAGSETICSGDQANNTMQFRGNGTAQQQKRARPSTPSGAHGNIFAYNPAAKRMSVTRVNVKDELVQILDGIKEAQLEREKGEARDEARWARLDSWLSGWESRRQIEEEASSTREKDLMDIAREALAEASAARRAVETMARAFAVANGMGHQEPTVIQEHLNPPYGDVHLATQAGKISTGKRRKEVINKKKVVDEGKAMVKATDKTKRKIMDERDVIEKEKIMEKGQKMGVEEQTTDKEKIMGLEAIMEVDFLAADETLEYVDLEMTDQLHEDRNVEMQQEEAGADMEKRKDCTKAERGSIQQKKITILKRPSTKIPKPTWATITGAAGANETTMTNRNAKSIRASATPGNGITPNDMAVRKHVRPDQRRIVFVRDGDTALPLADQTVEITSATNIALHLAGAPGHIRIERVQKSIKGTITAAAARGATAGMVIKFKETILKAIRKHDAGIIDLQTNEDWSRVKVHGIELSRYGKSPDGLQMLRQEIEAENPGVIVPMAVQWIKPWKQINERWQAGEIKASSVVVVIRDRDSAVKTLTTGLRVAGKRYDCERYERVGPDTQCRNCCEWGHIEARCPLAVIGTAKSSYCAGSHRTESHQCTVTDCTAAKGRVCQHIIPKCANCDESHFAHNNVCGNKKMAIALARTARSDSSPMTQLC